MRIVMAACLLTACALLSTPPTLAQRASRPTLSATDIDNIATLLKLEDTRQFDEATLTRLVASAHPEVKRRAIMSVGRIVNDQGRAILASLHGETDPELLATVAFATGQLKDADAIAWLGALLSNPRAASAVRREAAQALGKMAPAAATPPQPLTPPGRAAHDALAGFLAAAPMSSPAVVVGEALLSIGRFPTMEDPAPIVRWTTSRDVEVRWRAAWALFRPRNPAATPALLTLTADAAAEVRFWAVRGLTAAVVSQSSVPLATASARLRQALNDPDRRVRTEAVRALVAFDAALPSARYDDDASFDAAVKALQSSDTWMSISAIESLQRFPRAPSASRPCSSRRPERGSRWRCASPDSRRWPPLMRAPHGHLPRSWRRVRTPRRGTRPRVSLANSTPRPHAPRKRPRDSPRRGPVVKAVVRPAEAAPPDPRWSRAPTRSTARW